MKVEDILNIVGAPSEDHISIKENVPYGTWLLENDKKEFEAREKEISELQSTILEALKKIT
jgi:hypothetical protein